MSVNRYLIVHKDQPLSVKGPNAGAETATLALAHSLASLGKEVTLAAQLREPASEDTLSKIPFRLIELGADYNFEPSLKLLDTEGSFHLISAGSGAVLVSAARFSSVSSRSLLCPDPSPEGVGIALAELEENCDQVICVSKAQRQLFTEAGFDENKINVVYNGVDTEEFYFRPGQTRDWRKLVFSGALVRDKGLDLLLQSFIELRDEFPGLSLDVYGSASLWNREDYFDTQAIQRQVPGIQFHGKVSQRTLSQAFRRAGVCVVPSIWFDALNLTSLEAQTCGCPVVAFNVGGIPEGIADGESGVIAGEPAVANLTKALRELLSNRQRHEAMSSRAAEVAASRFSWEKNAKETIALCESFTASTQASAPLASGRLGIVTTWNQPCGLATYMSFLSEALEPEEFAVFAEDHPLANKVADDSNVHRVWQRISEDFSALFQAVREEGIETLLLNAQPHFFKAESFWTEARKFQEGGGRVVLLLHSVFKVRKELRHQLEQADAVIVHNKQSRLEIIANGGSAEKTFVVPHGVSSSPELTDSEKEKVRAAAGVAPGEQFVLTNGFIQEHKGIDELIEAVSQLRELKLPVKLVVVGAPHAGDEDGARYFNELKQQISSLELEDSVVMRGEFLPEETLRSYLSAADCVVLNYNSNHYEASGSCSLAVGAGAAVATTTAPCFQSFEDATWKISKGFPVTYSVFSILSFSELANELRANAKRYSEENSWSRTATRLKEIFSDFENEVETMAKEQSPENRAMTARSATPRVLVWNRPNAATQPGGDTVVMNRTVDGLRSKGYDVTVDLTGQQDPASFDLVHLFNFALPDLLRTQAQRCLAASTPYVVTTLCEDIPNFHNQSVAVTEQLIAYVQSGQSEDWWSANFRGSTGIAGCPAFDNQWVSDNAAALITNGISESAVIKRTFGEGLPVKEVHLGSETEPGDPSLFIQEYGLKDFVLCVGRIESRKNQLMLLKALEQLDIPVVLAAGGFSYQPDYDQAVRAFRRAGKTVVLGRLDSKMLASAYAAAKVHVLPSWYELPGLVSLEAAVNNCNVVVSETGTTKDYFGSTAFYCSPDNADSIRNAVLAAYYSPFNEQTKAQAESFTWARCVEETEATYRSVIPSQSTAQPAIRQEAVTRPPLVAQPVASTTAVSVSQEIDASTEQLLNTAEEAARERSFDEALERFDRILASCPQLARAIRGKAAVHFSRGEKEEARGFFQEAHRIEPDNPRNLSGLGMCFMSEENAAEAYPFFVQALELDGSQIVAILQLMECAYRLNRFEDLERVLKAYLELKPTDLNMRFSYAGCLYQLSQFDAAHAETLKILEEDSQHESAKELQEKIASQRTQAVAAPAVPSTTSTSGFTQSLEASSIPETPVEATSSRTPLGNQIEVQQVEPTAMTFSSIDAELLEIEDLKRQRRFDEASHRVSTMARSASLTAQQSESLETLSADLICLSGNVEEGEGIYKQIVTKNPRATKAICGLAAIAASRGNWDEAKAGFENALNIDPKCDMALAGMGIFHVSQSDQESGWSYFLKALEVNPENSRALYGVIDLGHALGRLSEVESALENYLEMHPADLNFLYSLAGCYYAQERLGDAQHEVEKIILLDPAHEMAQELSVAIEQKMAGQFETAGQ